MEKALNNRILSGPTRDEIRDAIFPPPAVTELLWLTFIIEDGSTSSSWKLAVQGLVRQGGDVVTLYCSDGSNSYVILYNVETKQGLANN